MSTTPSGGPHDDSDLRRLMAEAVSDVRPTGGPEQVRARVSRPAPGGWLPITLAAAVATVVVIGGAAWLGQREPGGLPAAGEATPTPGRTIEVPVYYARTDEVQGGRPALVVEHHRVHDVTASNLQVALDQAMRGRPLDPDYQNAWTRTDVTAHATASDSEITIDLRRADGADVRSYGNDAQQAFQALVWTADAATESNLPVRFTVDGKQGKEFLGFDISRPVRWARADSVLAAVSIDSPAEGATVPSQFEVQGDAATFEGNVVWELKDGETVVRSGFTTAKECCTRSPYAFTVSAPPGDYTLVVHDTDESGGEGNGVSQDTKAITVE